MADRFDKARELYQRITGDDEAEFEVTELADPESFPAVPGYVIESEIGAGGSGTVYAGRSATTDTRVAIKVMHDAYGQSAAGSRWREIRLLSQLRLACVPRILDYGESNGRPFIVTEFIDGQAIDEALASEPLRAQVEVIARTARALHSLHERGVLHRDVKPSNILINRDGDPIIIDLGIASLMTRSPEDTMTLEGRLIGTPAFMSPEQARGEIDSISARSDIYGLAATAYRVLACRSPHDVAGGVHDVIRRAAQDAVTSLHAVASEVPVGLSAVIMKALAMNPAGRFESAAAFGDDLQRWLRGEPTIARPPRGIRRLIRWTTRTPLRASMAVATFVVIGALGVIASVWLSERAMRITARAGGDGIVTLMPDYFGAAIGTSFGGPVDLDADGEPDVLMGMPGLPDAAQDQWGTYEGAVLAFPVDRLLAENERLLGLDGIAHARLIRGARREGLGMTAVSVGDVDGDGYDDAAVSGNRWIGNAAEGGTSDIHILFGGPHWQQASNWSVAPAIEEALRSPRVMETLRLEANPDAAATGRAQGVGDVTGDGIADVFIIWNQSAFLLEGGAALRRAGHLTHAEVASRAIARFSDVRSVATFDDLDGDGLGELLFGCVEWTVNEDGRRQVAPGHVRLVMTRALLDEPDAAFAGATRFNGAESGDSCGNAIACAGDINADGFADIIIGAPEPGVGSGEAGGRAYIVYGHTKIGDGREVDLGKLDGLNGFIIEARPAAASSDDYLGRVVAPIGDFDGDGIDDVAICAMRSDANGIDSGAVYVLLGTTDPRPAHTTVAPDAFDLGIVICGGAKDDHFGNSILPLGDINNDGCADLLIGATGGASSGASDSGDAHVVLGRSRVAAWLAE